MFGNNACRLSYGSNIVLDLLGLHQLCLDGIRTLVGAAADLLHGVQGLGHGVFQFLHLAGNLLHALGHVIGNLQDTIQQMTDMIILLLDHGGLHGIDLR